MNYLQGYDERIFTKSIQRGGVIIIGAASMSDALQSIQFAPNVNEVLILDTNFYYNVTDAGTGALYAGNTSCAAHIRTTDNTLMDRPEHVAWVGGPVEAFREVITEGYGLHRFRLRNINTAGVVGLYVTIYIDTVAVAIQSIFYTLSFSYRVKFVK